MGRERVPRLRSVAAVLAVLVAAPRATVAAEEFHVDVKDPVVRVQAELDLFLNGAAAGTSLVVLERGDALILPSDLARAGLAPFGGKRVTIDGRELVSLRSLAPGVTFEVDERALSLRITAAPELLGRHVLDLRPRLRPAGAEQHLDASAFLNYAADSDLAGHLGLSFEAGGRAGAWLATTGLTRDVDGQWVRGMSAAVRDDVVRLQRLTVGDTVASSGMLGGSSVVGGLSFGRDDSLDPYLVRAPLPSMTTVVTAPSTLIVYVNGMMVRQQSLAPGYWDLANLPGMVGQSNVRAVVRDAFGRERAVDGSFYLSSGALAPGFTDYGITAGFVRKSFGIDSFSYGPPAVAGQYRFGYAGWLTPGVRAEASPDVASAGGSVSVATRWGQLDAAASASAAGAGPGGAGLLTWGWQDLRYSAALRLTGQSDRYANLSLGPFVDRAVLDADAVAGATVWRGFALGVELRGGRFRDLGAYRSAGVRGSVPVGAGFSLMLSADYGNFAAGPTGALLLALLTWGRAGYSADAGVTRDREGNTSGVVAASKALPRDTGIGWRVQGTANRVTSGFDADLQGQTTVGRADLEVARTGDTTAYHARASGGLVYVDRHVFPSRATEGAFALVSANGVPGVGITAENVPVGRTGSDGTLLVMDLQPYYATRFGLQDADVPSEYDVGRSSRYVIPPLRGGAIVRFDLQRISAITGQLAVRVRGEAQRPANGELSAIVDGVLRTSPITEDGRFFLERMPPGKHVVQAVWGGGSCRAAVTLPEPAPPVYDAGEVRCILDTLDPSGRIPKLTDPGYADQPLPSDVGAGGGGG